MYLKLLNSVTFLCHEKIYAKILILGHTNREESQNFVYCSFNKNTSPHLLLQGDGTAFIFENQSEVFTLSFHCQNNFPLRKQKSDLDVGLAVGMDDDEYLRTLAVCTTIDAKVTELLH